MGRRGTGEAAEKSESMDRAVGRIPEAKPFEVPKNGVFAVVSRT